MSPHPSKSLPAHYEWLLSISKSTIFWNVTLCSPLNVNRRFGRTYRLHLQGQDNKLRKKLAWKHPLLAICFHAGFFLSLLFWPWKWRRYVPPKRRLTFKGLHSVISQNMVLFITTAMRTSNSTLNLVDDTQQTWPNVDSPAIFLSKHYCGSRKIILVHPFYTGRWSIQRQLRANHVTKGHVFQSTSICGPRIS
jgi:hypothetical protein